MKQTLTTRQRLFVEAYLVNANGVQAAKKAGYKGSDRQLSVIAAQNLAKVNIRLAVEKRVETAIITANEILTDVKQIAKGSERDADRLKAYEMLGKHLAMWTDKTEINGELTLATRVIKPESV